MKTDIHTTEGLSTRERILGVAMELFFTMEYNKVTLKGIAEKAGVTKGGIYHYFESKDQLLSEAMMFSFSNMMDSMELVLTGHESTEDVIKQWFNFERMMGDFSVIMDGGDTFKALLQFMYLMFTALRKFPELSDSFSGIYTDSIDMIEKLIIKGKNAGEIRSSVNTRGLALQLVTCFEGSVLIGSVGPNFKLDEIGELLYKSIWEQIRAT